MLGQRMERHVAIRMRQQSFFVGMRTPPMIIGPSPPKACTSNRVQFALCILLMDGSGEVKLASAKSSGRVTLMLSARPSTNADEIRNIPAPRLRR